MAMLQTKYGPIHDVSGPCKDNYTNIKLFHTGNGQTVKLQAPALISYQEAAKKVKGIPLTGSWRSCKYQTELYASDSSRYANPAGTGHTRGLCIDVSTAQSAYKLTRIHRALLARDWHQARSDEPWHYSFHVSL